MYKGLRVIAMAPVFNEEKKIGEVVRRMPRDVVDEVLVIDDGCTDNSVAVAKSHGAEILSVGESGRLVGVGAGLRAGYEYAMENGYDVAVVIAGNNKDSPEEIPLLLEPIAAGRADFVQGSRYLKENPDFGEMPVYRKVATRVHPVFFSAIARKWVTDSTNGFRAIHRRVLTDPRLNLRQEWLDEYELEPYLFMRSIQMGFRIAEAPVSKVYPPKHLGQTKMKPITGWWSILRPLVYMGLKIRK